MKPYYMTVGLEIHAELSTASKMFCRCKNDPFAAEPNTNICSVCTSQPGMLPVPNHQAIENVIRVGLAIGGNIANYSEFDRKNYFYPDIPKGYQISQYKYPIVSGGELAGVAITRIHLEEDTGNSIHEGTTTLADYNRSGVPLMELVTEPVIHDVETIGKFGKELQLLLRRLGVSDADMEKGQMRVEVNVSISPDPAVLGTLVEVKNINSFSAAMKAAQYEVERMSALWEAGRQDELVRETRGWDDPSQSTKSQRSKESAMDYRYFPEPNIPKMYLHEMFDLQKLSDNLPELPWEQRIRYAAEYGIKETDIDVLVMNNSWAKLFEETVAITGANNEIAQKVANFIITDVSGLFTEFSVEQVMGYVIPERLAELVTMYHAGELSSRAAKDILLVIANEGGMPRTIANERGLIQKNDDEFLMAIVDTVIAENPDPVKEFKGGKDGAIMFLVGQAMKQSRGAGNPGKFQELLRAKLA